VGPRAGLDGCRNIYIHIRTYKYVYIYIYIYIYIYTLIHAQTHKHTHTHTDSSSVVLPLPILKVVGSNLGPVTSYPCDDLLELPRSLQGQYILLGRDSHHSP
jgi:hypothetical protein